MMVLLTCCLFGRVRSPDHDDELAAFELSNRAGCAELVSQHGDGGPGWWIVACDFKRFAPWQPVHSRENRTGGVGAHLTPDIDLDQRATSSKLPSVAHAHRTTATLAISRPGSFIQCHRRGGVFRSCSADVVVSARRYSRPGGPIRLRLPR